MTGFSTIVSDYIGVGLAVDRAATPNIETGCGSLWFSSDTVAPSLWDGSSWHNLALVPSAGVVISDGTLLSPAVLVGLTLSGGTLTAAPQATFADTLSAAGTVQGTATTLTDNINVVTTIAPGSGMRLALNPAPGFTQKVFARGGANLLVYPASGAEIEALGTNAAATVVDGGAALFTAETATEWLAS